MMEYLIFRKTDTMDTKVGIQSFGDLTRKMGQVEEQFSGR